MYKPIYDRASVGKRIAEIFTWVFLLFLIPTTALGYFAEGSIPGQPLYPMKRGIENVVLTLQFFNRNSQAAYQVNLVNKRFNEAEQLLTMDTSNAQDLQNLSSQLETTKNFLLSMPDSPEKRQIQQTLIVNIQQYQQKIQQQQQILQNRQQILQIQLQQNFGQQNFTQQQQAPTPTQAQQQNQQLTNFNNPPPPTYTPAPTSTQQTTDSSIQNTEQMSASLTQLQIQMQQTSAALTYGGSPTPTDTPSPTATDTPTDTPAATPTNVPTPTNNPAGIANCAFVNGQCVASQNDCKTYVMGYFNFPNACSQSNPICCRVFTATPPPTYTPIPTYSHHDQSGH